MGGMFSPEGTVWNWLTKFTNLVILNVLWILCCLPVITAGAATTALYSVLLKMAQNTEGYIVKEYFKAFKKNFRQALVIWAGILLFGITIAAEVLYYIHCPGNGKWILYLPVCCNIFILLTVLYVFPVLAFFKDPVKQILKNSFYMAIGNLPQTILILLFTLLPAAFLWLFWGFIKIASFVLLVIGFSLCAFLKAKCLYRVFKRYIPAEETQV